MDDAGGNSDVDDPEILAVLANADEPWLRTGEIADDLPIADERLADRLDDLRERGLVDRDGDDLPGERWRLTPGAADRASIPESAVETDVEAQAARATGTETPAREAETSASPPPEPQSTVPGEPYRPPADEIEAFDPPGTPEQKERRREALRRAHAFLRDRGHATRAEFESAVFPEARGAYERPDDGWWERVVRPGLARLPDVEPVDDSGDGDGGDEWRYAGERDDFVAE